MADDSWQKVREIFDSALRRQPEERRKFINIACCDDKTLLAEVELNHPNILVVALMRRLRKLRRRSTSTQQRFIIKRYIGLF